MSSNANAVSQFIQMLETFPSMSNVFNPWRDIDSVNDNSQAAAQQRRCNLHAYLTERQNRARVLLVGEAPGFNGCKFSGIAMTSERILLGHHPKVAADCVFDGPKARTSVLTLKPLGMAEPTASIAWAMMHAAGFDSREFAIWNAFAFHPHRPEVALSNRAPTQSELDANQPILQAYLALFPQAQVIAVGRVAQRTLHTLGIEATAVRHPAMGGANEFREQMATLLTTHSLAKNQ